MGTPDTAGKKRKVHSEPFMAGRGEPDYIQGCGMEVLQRVVASGIVDPAIAGEIVKKALNHSTPGVREAAESIRRELEAWPQKAR